MVRPLFCVSGYFECGGTMGVALSAVAVFILCHHRERDHKIPLSIFISSSKANRQGTFRGDKWFHSQIWLFEFDPYRGRARETKNWFMLSVRISSYGCTQEVWRARKKRKSCSRR